MKTFGIISSILLWGVAIWALAQPVKTDLHTGIIIVAAVILVVHFIEVSFFFWHPRMRRHLSAKNVGLTLLSGVHHFMPLYKGTAEELP